MGVISVIFFFFFHRCCGKAVLNTKGKMVIQLSEKLLKLLPGRETVNALVVSLFSFFFKLTWFFILALYGALVPAHKKWHPIQL